MAQIHRPTPCRVNHVSVFCYTGLSKAEVSRLKEEYHIYITADGRISMAGITSANVEYVAKAIHAVAA